MLTGRELAELVTDYLAGRLAFTQHDVAPLQGGKDESR